MADIDKCKCSMSIRMLGDGCRYCQPQTYIDIMHDAIEALEEELEDMAEFRPQEQDNG